MTEAEEFIKERGFDIRKMTRDDYFNEAYESYLVRMTAQRELRSAYIARFGFAIITDEITKIIADYSPLVEVGCGSGYWAYELRKIGVDIVPTDYPTSFYRFFSVAKRWENNWLEIEHIEGKKAVQKYPDRNLLTVWPDYSDDWPTEMLKTFKGDTVIYVGEWNGCTADEEFHNHLEEHFNKIKEIDIPKFDGLFDDLTVWKRK